MTQRNFHADAMAMLSWAADERGRLNFLSPSFRELLQRLIGHNCAEPEGGDNPGITVLTGDKQIRTALELFEWLFDRGEEAGDGGLEAEPKPSEWIKAVREHLDQADGAGTDGASHGTCKEVKCGLVSIHRDVPHDRVAWPAEGGEVHLPTRSARVLHPHGLRVRNGGLRDIFDLVFVRRMAISTSDSREPKEHASGYQGLLQPAWERVEPVVRANVRTASLRLISRSLSHNIGSHALMYVQKDLERPAGEVTGNMVPAEHAALYRYLRERFEMMASVSVQAPLAWSRATVRELVDEFRKNKLLINSICRSEGIAPVVEGGAAIQIFPRQRIQDPLSVEIGLPGEYIARHAFFLFLENVARDCAKHQRGDQGGSSALQLHLGVYPAGDPGHPDSAWHRMEVWAQRASVPEESHAGRLGRLETMKQSAERLNNLIARGPLCDHEAIPPREWGTLERLVCACFLRGDRPEDLLFSEECAGDVTRISPSSGPGPLLSVRVNESDATFRWQLFVPHPRLPVLAFVGIPESEVEPSTNFHHVFPRSDELEKLGSFIPKGSSELGVVCSREALPHVMDFLDRHHHQLPGLTQVFARGGHPTSREDLLKAWVDARNPDWRVDFLAMQEHGPQHRSNRVGLCDDQLSSLLARDPDSEEVRRALDPDRPNRVLLVDHWNNGDAPNAIGARIVGGWREEVEQDGAIGAAHDFRCRSSLAFEGFRNSERLRDILNFGATPELVEEIARASIMRCLVVDERIGAPSGAADQPWGDLGTRRDRWSLAGVDIMRVDGGEADASLLDSIYRWLRVGDGLYDYAFIHLGVLEKCSNDGGKHDIKPEHRVWELMDSISREKGPKGADGSRSPLRLVVHSGRTVPRPPADLRIRPRFRFCPLGTIERLLVGPAPHCCKLDFVRMADAVFFRPEDLK